MVGLGAGGEVGEQEEGVEASSSCTRVTSILCFGVVAVVFVGGDRIGVCLLGLEDVVDWLLVEDDKFDDEDDEEKKEIRDWIDGTTSSFTAKETR